MAPTMTEAQAMAQAELELLDLEKEKAAVPEQVSSTPTPMTLHPIVEQAGKTLQQKVGKPFMESVTEAKDAFVREMPTVEGTKAMGRSLLNFGGRAAELANQSEAEGGFPAPVVDEAIGIGRALREVFDKIPKEERPRVLAEMGIVGTGSVAGTIAGGAVGQPILGGAAGTAAGQVVSDSILEYFGMKDPTSAATKIGKSVGSGAMDLVSAKTFEKLAKIPGNVINIQERNPIRMRNKWKNIVKTKEGKALVAQFDMPQTLAANALRDRMEEGVPYFARLKMKGRTVAEQAKELSRTLFGSKDGLFARKRKVISELDNAMNEFKATQGGKHFQLIKETDLDTKEYRKALEKYRSAEVSLRDVEGGEEILKSLRSGFGEDIFEGATIGGKQVILNKPYSLSQINEKLEVIYDNRRILGEWDLSKVANGASNPSIQKGIADVLDAQKAMSEALRGAKEKKIKEFFEAVGTSKESKGIAKRLRQLDINPVTEKELGLEIQGLMPYLPAYKYSEWRLVRDLTPQARTKFGGAGNFEGVTGVGKAATKQITDIVNEPAALQEVINLDRKMASGISETSKYLDPQMSTKIGTGFVDTIDSMSEGFSDMVGLGTPIVRGQMRAAAPNSLLEALTRNLESSREEGSDIPIIAEAGKITPGTFYGERTDDEVERLVMPLPFSPETKNALVDSAQGTVEEQRTAIGMMQMEAAKMGLTAPSSMKGVHSFVSVEPESDSAGLGILGYVTNDIEREIVRDHIKSDFAKDVKERSRLLNAFNENNSGKLLAIPPSLAKRPVPVEDEPPKVKNKPKKKKVLSSGGNNARAAIVKNLDGSTRTASKL